MAALLGQRRRGRPVAAGAPPALHELAVASARMKSADRPAPRSAPRRGGGILEPTCWSASSRRWSTGSWRSPACSDRGWADAGAPRRGTVGRGDGRLPPRAHRPGRRGRSPACPAPPAPLGARRRARGRGRVPGPGTTCSPTSPVLPDRRRSRRPGWPRRSMRRATRWRTSSSPCSTTEPRGGRGDLTVPARLLARAADDAFAPMPDRAAAFADSAIARLDERADRVALAPPRLAWPGLAWRPGLAARHDDGRRSPPPGRPLPADSDRAVRGEAPARRGRPVRRGGRWPIRRTPRRASVGPRQRRPRPPARAGERGPSGRPGHPAGLFGRRARGRARGAPARRPAHRSPRPARPPRSPPIGRDRARGRAGGAGPGNPAANRARRRAPSGAVGAGQAGDRPRRPGR